MILIVTDLDGTLLDHHTYSFADAQPALYRARAKGVPVVLCTSKCLAEVEPLCRAMGLSSPIIVENGGALIVPEGSIPGVDGQRIELGSRYPDLVAALDAASAESGVEVRGFSRMTDEEVAKRTGLPLEAASLARRREYDEPFIIENPHRPEDLLNAIERLGFRWTRGGRFFHIFGNCDKADAVRRLRELCRSTVADVELIGLGDSWNDIGFLRECDQAFVVASPRASEVAGEVPGAKITRLPGPAGWNETVLSLLGPPGGERVPSPPSP